MKILLAESDARASMELARELSAQGFGVVAGNDAIHTLNAARKEQPDAVLLSARLAGGGAVAALKRLRSNVYTTHIPVIGLVGRGGAKEGELMAAGAQACVAADAGIEALKKAIDSHLLQSLDFTQAPAEVLEAPERMAALHDSGLLDSPAEESFDRLTRLMARLLGAEAALVTLVDKDRQFFKSQVGLGDKLHGGRETQLSHSFCQWVVSGQEALEVGDAREHPVLRTNLAIRKLGVVAYAGVPLTGRGGHAIGSVCAIQSVPRQWAADDLATLRDMAKIAEAYGVLEKARRGEAGKGGNLGVSVHVAGGAILGVAGILRRHGAALSGVDREELLAILEEQSRHLMSLAS